ncbi:MAG TPA: M14 family zinc carboxypeptidase [Gemmatimonadaceae bacterium]
MSALSPRGLASLAPSLLVALAVAGAAHAQTPRSAAQARASLDPPASAEETRDSAAVPQTFDWWTSRPIPATTPWGQPVDTASTRLIRSWTTMPEYTTSLVDHLPEDARVVSPTDHFGHPIGKPGVLHTVDEIHGYFAALAASTPRVRVERLGETEEGNHLALVQVGSEANLARLDAVKQGMRALADPRAADSAAAARLVAELPVVYTFYAGLHSTETGPPEMVMELAYRLAVSDDPTIRTIRDSVVVFIIPVAEPDGRNRVVDWHRRHNANVTSYEDRVPGPPYWGTYIFHDNNRDGIQLSARLTQEAVKLFEEWKYPIGHDLHESVPYLYVSTGTGPYNRELDPIAISEWQWMSNWEVTDLTARGLPGVWTHGFYDGWYPGYLLWVTNTRNAVGRFYETFGNSIPATVKRELGARQTGIEWYRPSPPRKETLWSMRNNTNYMQSGALSVLGLAAQHRTRILSQYREKALHAVERGRTEAPHAYVVPVAQPRRADAGYMVDLLRRQGIEVHRAERAGTFGTTAVAAGDFVVRMDQPYRNFVKMLMDVQRFPENAPRPYDDVAWTFPYMFNVEVRAVADSAVLRAPMRPVADSVTIAGSLTTARRAAWWVVAPEASAHAVRARYALRDVAVFAAEESLTVAGRTLPPGAWLVEMSRVGQARMDSLARAHGLVVLAAPASAVERVARHEMNLPRIALLHSWRNTQDEGWARFTLERMGIPYTYIGEDKLRTGTTLAGRFDVVLFPSQGANAGAKQILQGVDPKFSPLPYTRTAEFPTHGYPDSTSDMTGGMGYEGLAALRDFVQQGGTLVTLGSASTVPVELGLLRDVSRESPRNLFVPGSIVRGRVAQAKSPIVYGYDAAVPLYHRFGPYFELPDRLKGNVVMRYAKADSVFMSGLVQHPEELAEKPAVVALPTGKGTVVLFGFNPLHRYQSFGNFALVWNAIMHWNDLRVGLPREGEAAVADGH